MKHATIAALTILPIVAASIPALASVPPTPAATPLVTTPADDGATVLLRGEMASAVSVSQDLGRLAGDVVFPHLKLILKRSPARQAALDRLVSDQLKPGNPAYGRWVTPAELFPAFGPAQSDIDRVTAWLTRHGFTVHGASADGMTIDFAGTARQVEESFHTDIHMLSHHGETHFANVIEPAIPMAFRDVVAGITLHNFFPMPALEKTGLVRRTGNTSKGRLVSPAPAFAKPYDGYTYQLIGPNDFTLIYNVDPLLNGNGNFGNNPLPLTGAGATIALLGDSDMQPRDWQHFRTAFGYSQYKGTLSIQHPGNCGDPGLNDDADEASLDVEYGSISAPDANVILAACPSANLATSSGVFTALENMVSLGTPAQMISVSFIYCETGYGPTVLQAWNQAAEEGAAEGISIFVASGDAGSAACDDPFLPSPVVSGLAVNGLASSPYVTAVGGTDFSDYIDGQSSVYFATENRSGLENALSYVPEVPWNASCANPLLLQHRVAEGKTTATDPISYCNSADGANFLEPLGGSGGRSAVYAKPDWQTLDVYGMPDDGRRDLPDVSLFASSGIFHRSFVYCSSNKSVGNAPCDYKNGLDALYNSGGGTSFDTPAFASIMLLETENRAMQMQAAAPVRIGNVAPRLYQIAAAQFSNDAGITPCKASLGNKIGAACVFHTVTQSNISEPCLAGTPNCFTNAESTAGIGVLSENATTGKPEAYVARPGYSLATGLGSVNALNLINAY